MSSRKNKTSSHITYEDDNEDLVDEISTFHKKERNIEKGALHKRKAFDRPEEVLNVEAEASDSSEDDGSDFDDDNEEINGITDNKWGNKRKDFYGTGFVDKDWGGMREEEMEDAQLEEEDALARQKQFDKSTAVIADLFNEEDEEENMKIVEVSTVIDFNEENARKRNRKVANLLEQFEARKRIFDLVVKPLESIIKQIPKCALRSQLVYVSQTYASYLMNAVFFLNLRAKHFSKGKLDDPLVDIHPVVEALKQLEKKITECEDFLHANSDQLDELKKWAASEPENIKELISKVGNVQLSKKTIGNIINNNYNASESSATAVGSSSFTAMDVDKKRKASDKISKNREYAERRGKKKAKISKTKNRRKVRAIEKRVKSQIGNVRREIHKYSGETSGIRASTIKSTKLIA